MLTTTLLLLMPDPLNVETLTTDMPTLSIGRSSRTRGLRVVDEVFFLPYAKSHIGIRSQFVVF